MKIKRLHSLIPWGVAILCPISMFVISSCDSGSDNPSSTNISDAAESRAVIIDTNNFVDPLIRPFLDSFIAELEARQISADLSNISMEFVDDFGEEIIGISQGGTVAGICFFNTGLIQIDSIFITNPSFLLEVIYHEL